MKGFLSDNSSGVDSEIMTALIEANKEHTYPYGNDDWTQALEQKVKQIFGEKANMTVVFNGTSANVLGLMTGLHSYHSVIAVDSSHINVDECGAFEKITGAKIVTVPAKNGKLTLGPLERLLMAKGNFHHNQPKIISISQLTEFGTCYTIEEIRAIAEYAHKNDLLLHVDGARIANACVSQNKSLKEMITDTGVDILSLGGTKNGLMFGEVIINFDQQLQEQLSYYRKQTMQLASKMRFISAQFLTYFEQSIFEKNADWSNKMGQLMYVGLKGNNKISFLESIEGNMLFVKMPCEWVKRLKEKFHFYVMDEAEGSIRLVMSFDTSQDEVAEFVKAVNELKG
jgi:threonine aldolase